MEPINAAHPFGSHYGPFGLHVLGLLVDDFLSLLCSSLLFNNAPLN
jgi:hypothetical protein